MTDDNNAAPGGENGAEKKPADTTAKAPEGQTNDGGAAKTALDDDGSSNEQKAPEKSWRDRMAGEDEAFRKQLDRYGSEADVGKKIREMEKVISKMPKTLPENPTPEQLAEYRKANGLPESPDGYAVKLPDGMKFTEEDKPMVDAFLKQMHDHNTPPAVVNAALGWYMSTQEQAVAKAKETENLQRQEAITALRNELGPEYKATQGMIQAWLGRQGDIGETLLNARGADGKALFNDANFVMWLNNHIRQTEPSATVIHDAELSGSSVEEEISKIQAVIRDTPEKYYSDPKMQERMKKLSAAKSKRVA